jgi:hypothetical protein
LWSLIEHLGVLDPAGPAGRLPPAVLMLVLLVQWNIMLVLFT